jgi:hypothetical protein
MPNDGGLNAEEEETADDDDDTAAAAASDRWTFFWNNRTFVESCMVGNTGGSDEVLLS